MSSPALASPARDNADVGKAAAAMLRDVLSLDERKALLRINPLRSLWMVASNWLAIFAVIFGNEVTGVEQSTIALCDDTIEIPQLGMKHSLNIATAAGVVLWELIRGSIVHFNEKGQRG